METAVIVKVAVSAAPYSIDKPYDYLVPQELLETAVPGARVQVPFGQGNRSCEGILLVWRAYVFYTSSIFSHYLRYLKM